MMGRRFVGQLPGGRPQVAEPSLPFHFDVGTHAPGRLNAERKKLLHLACVKAWGKLGDNPTLTYSGAVYQDFKGTRRYQRCHRSLFEPIVNGSALPDIPAFALQPRLRTILLAPGAVTDPEPPPGNYGDRLLEIVASGPITELIRSTLLRQPANRRLEINLLQHVFADVLPALLQRAYDDALAKADAIRKKRGWIEVPREGGREAAARIWRANAPRGQADSRAKTIEDLMQELRSSGPQSELVSERVNELQFECYEAGPSQYGEVAIDYLRQCQDCTKHSSPSLVNIEEIKQACAQLEAAARL